MSEVVQFKPKQEPGYFGGCPECGGDDGCLNVGRNHWFKCDEHKTTWWVGSNLFSFWREETEADWQLNADRLDGHRIVKPIYAEPTEEERRERERLEKDNAEAKRIDKGYGVAFGPDGMRALEADEIPF